MSNGGASPSVAGWLLQGFRHVFPSSSERMMLASKDGCSPLLWSASHALIWRATARYSEPSTFVMPPDFQVQWSG